MLIPLSAGDLIAASVLVVVLALLTIRLRLGVARQMLWLAARSAAQLLLIGLVLRLVFGMASLPIVVVIGAVMLVVAAREVRSRQSRPLPGPWGFASGGVAMFLSSFTVTVFALIVVIEADPWWNPRFAIPVFGMLLGNTMTGVALSTERLVETITRERSVVEQRLMLGERGEEAVADTVREAARAGLIPMFNALAAAGVVSLPGMMTGQILAGAAPIEAVKYQILILLMILAGTGFGVLLALRVTSRRLFDERHRLRLDRLAG